VARGSDSGEYTHVDKPVPFHVYGQIDLAQPKVRASDVETSAFNYAIGGHRSAIIAVLAPAMHRHGLFATREGVCSSNTDAELQHLISGAGQ
jgi:hypothetical protein